MLTQEEYRGWSLRPVTAERVIIPAHFVGLRAAQRPVEAGGGRRRQRFYEDEDDEAGPGVGAASESGAAGKRTATAPDQLWMTDRTFGATWAGVAYLCFIVEVSRMIVG